jgi:hypothetical protein
MNIPLFNFPVPRARSAGCLIAAAAALLAPLCANAGTPIVTVYAKTWNGYKRTVQADNTYKPETYAFASGGRMDGVLDDDSIDNLKFVQVAGVVAASLKHQNYLQATNANNTDLLLILYWGTTGGYDEGGYQRSMATLSTDFALAQPVAIAAPGASTMSGIVDTQRVINDSVASQLDATFDKIALANQERDQNNQLNARILGYQTALDDTNFLRPYSIAARDVLSEVEESRYFVILKAYDFQKLRKHQGKVLLWETRYSIARHGNRFDEQLVDMTRYATQFAGQEVGPLLRRHIREGKVEVGTPVEVSTPTNAK